MENATNKEKHLKQLNEFLSLCLIIPVTRKTSKIYGNIKSKLKAAGTPIPENDIWIAAQTIEHEATLLSNDKHFKLIQNLRTENIF